MVFHFWVVLAQGMGNSMNRVQYKRNTAAGQQGIVNVQCIQIFDSGGNTIKGLLEPIGVGSRALEYPTLEITGKAVAVYAVGQHCACKTTLAGALLLRMVQWR